MYSYITDIVKYSHQEDLPLLRISIYQPPQQRPRSVIQEYCLSESSTV